MPENKQNLSDILKILQTPAAFTSCLENIVEVMSKTCPIPQNFTVSFIQLIRTMCTCLAVDYFLQKGETEQQDQQASQSLENKKTQLLQAIKREVAVLTMQLKLTERLKMEMIQIVVTKVIKQLISRNKQHIEQQKLYTILNMALWGYKISSKCYKLSINRLAQSATSSTKENHKLKAKRTLSHQNNLLFRQTFLSLSNIQEEKPPVLMKTPTNTEGSKKIIQIIRKVRRTIQEESKKFAVPLKQKEEKVRNRMRSKTTQQFVARMCEQDMQRQGTNKQISCMPASLPTRKQALTPSKLKRVQSANHQKIKSKVLLLDNISAKRRKHREVEQENSSDTLPSADENWMSSKQKNDKPRKILVLCMPKLKV